MSNSLLVVRLPSSVSVNLCHRVVQVRLRCWVEVFGRLETPGRLQPSAWSLSTEKGRKRKKGEVSQTEELRSIDQGRLYKIRQYIYPSETNRFQPNASRYDGNAAVRAVEFFADEKKREIKGNCCVWYLRE